MKWIYIDNRLQLLCWFFKIESMTLKEHCVRKSVRLSFHLFDCLFKISKTVHHQLTLLPSCYTRGRPTKKSCICLIYHCYSFLFRLVFARPIWQFKGQILIKWPLVINLSYLWIFTILAQEEKSTFLICHISFSNSNNVNMIS